MESRRCTGRRRTQAAYSAPEWIGLKTSRHSYGSPRRRASPPAAAAARCQVGHRQPHQALEDHVGAPLFHRSTRVVRLSDVGQAFLRDCIEVVGRANDLLDLMRGARAGPTGTLRIHALTGFVLGHFAALPGEFQTSYPDIHLELSSATRWSTRSRRGWTAHCRSSRPHRPNWCRGRCFRSSRLLRVARVLEAHGRPESPRDLHKHPLGLYSGYPTRDRWTFHHA